MQLTMSLDILPVPQSGRIQQSNLWIDVTPQARMIGFTQKVEVSQQLDDVLQPLSYEDQADYEQRLYDAIWLAHYILCLQQQTSISFTVDFLHYNFRTGKMIETVSDCAWKYVMEQFCLAC